MSKGTKITLISVISFLVLVILGVGGLFVATKVVIPSQKYNKACELIKDGEYDDAIDIFESLGDYKDSEKKIQNAKYKKACKLREKEKYEKALKIFKELDDYKDSEDQVEELEELLSLEAAPAATVETAPVVEEAAPVAEEAAPAAEEPAPESTDFEDPYYDSDDKFYIYSWNSEVQDRLDYVYDEYPELRDKIVFVNVEDYTYYQDTIDAYLLGDIDSEEYPDMFAIEPDYIRKYIDSRYVLPVSDLGITNNDMDNMFSYTLDVGRSSLDNSVRALTWQICPGTFTYRADLASKYLGINSPEEMQSRISTLEGFVETAKELQAATSGSVRMLSSVGDLDSVYRYYRTQNLVDDGEFRVDDSILEYLEFSRLLTVNKLSWQNYQWTEAWYKGMSDNTVLGYFGCNWFNKWIIETECGGKHTGQGTYGLWNVCQGPVAFNWGGTYLGVSEGCSNKKIAGIILKTLCCNTQVMEKVSEETLDFVNNEVAMWTLSAKGYGNSDFLGGQDYIAVSIHVANNVDYSYFGDYDYGIFDIVKDEREIYADGNETLDNAIENIGKEVTKKYPDLSVW